MLPKYTANNSLFAITKVFSTYHKYGYIMDINRAMKEKYIPRSILMASMHIKCFYDPLTTVCGRHLSTSNTE